MRVRVVRIRPADRPAYQARVAALERLASYPLGDDRFELDHGPDYFAFFDRLGQVETYAALVGQRVVAVACGILRRVALRAGEAPKRVWYLCDLKVDPELRGQRIPLRILGRAFAPNYVRCQRAYAISMNPGDGRPNPVVRLATHWKLAPIRFAGELSVYSFDADQMRAAASIAAPLRGPLAYRSLRGIKDLILESTGAPLPLLHAVPTAPGTLAEPIPDTTHMLCAATDDPLAAALTAAGLAPSASASLLAHRLPGCDWRFVTTSDI